MDPTIWTAQSPKWLRSYTLGAGSCSRLLPSNYGGETPGWHEAHERRTTTPLEHTLIQIHFWPASLGCVEPRFSADHRLCSEFLLGLQQCSHDNWHGLHSDNSIGWCFLSGQRSDKDLERQEDKSLSSKVQVLHRHPRTRRECDECNAATPGNEQEQRKIHLAPKGRILERNYQAWSRHSNHPQNHSKVHAIAAVRCSLATRVEKENSSDTVGIFNFLIQNRDSRQCNVGSKWQPVAQRGCRWQIFLVKMFLQPWSKHHDRGIGQGPSCKVQLRQEDGEL